MAHQFTSNNDEYDSSISTPSPQLSFGAQDPRYAFWELVNLIDRRPSSLASRFGPNTTFGQSAPKLGLPHEPCSPNDGYAVPQLQPLPPLPCSTSNNDQWSSAAGANYQNGQWPATPIADPQYGQAFLDGSNVLASAPLDFDWPFDDPVTTGDVGSAFNFDMSTQLEVPAVPSATRPVIASRAQEDILTCPQGCPATFGCAVDYRRHMLNHQPHKFKCMFADCDKTFPRMDKLNDHFRQGHHSDMKITRAAARTNPRKATGEKRARR